ncbi:chemotaxis protein CheW [Bosea sp. TAF32]|uniref:chemotaxis protein CheW n=1 Tax=Bosea sp. TAF32 TaxID=3237482 RepID=UPI003F8FABD7
MKALMIGLGPEIFAIETEMVREIIDPVPLTRVAGARPHLPGLINVRGNIIPLADLRERFGMPQAEATPDTRIVVIEVEIDDDPVTLGIIADKVYEVTEISRDDIQTTPRIGMNWRPEYIQFITKWNDEFIIVPSISTILI